MCPPAHHHDGNLSPPATSTTPPPTTSPSTTPPADNSSSGQQQEKQKECDPKRNLEENKTTTGEIARAISSDKTTGVSIFNSSLRPLHPFSATDIRHTCFSLSSKQTHREYSQKYKYNNRIPLRVHAQFYRSCLLVHLEIFLPATRTQSLSMPFGKPVIVEVAGIVQGWLPTERIRRWRHMSRRNRRVEKAMEDMS